VVRHVTSSGFLFERQEQNVVVRAPRPLVPMAELEFLREVEAPGGRIVELRPSSGDGRELHLVSVELAGGARRTVTFDAGPTRLSRLVQGLHLAVYAMAGATAVGTLGYMLAHWLTAISLD
jgi:hypothetical protein